MENYSSSLSVVTMSDLIRLHHVRLALRAIYDAVSSFNMAGKPAMLHTLNEADDDVCSVINKAANRAVERGLQGHFGRLPLQQDLIDYLVLMSGKAVEFARKNAKYRDNGRTAELFHSAAARKAQS